MLPRVHNITWFDFSIVNSVISVESSESFFYRQIAIKTDKHVLRVTVRFYPIHLHLYTEDVSAHSNSGAVVEHPTCNSVM